VITTEGDEVETPLVLIADWLGEHLPKILGLGIAHPPAKSAGRMGQPTELGRGFSEEGPGFAVGVVEAGLAVVAGAEEEAGASEEGG
jgi:hypothetical protein